LPDLLFPADAPPFCFFADFEGFAFAAAESLGFAAEASFAFAGAESFDGARFRSSSALLVMMPVARPIASPPW
jgi:hypothetical protein